MNFNIFSKIFKKTALRKIVVESNAVANSQYSLTPSFIEKTIIKKEGDEEKTENNPAYQPILEIAGKLNEKEIKNIALTGPFGSGKSSVLLTLQKDFGQYKYLNISLATLECIVKKDILAEENNKPEQEDSGNQVKYESRNDPERIKDFTKDETLNRKIEYSILQQLIYKEKAKDIPQSRFKRISHINKFDSYKLAVGFVFFILSCFILLEPKFLHIQSLYSFFACGKNWKIFWDIFLSLYVFIASIYLIKNLIIKTYNNRINKLNFKDGEIDIKESTSIFNKHLDEIIYFFEVTEYDVIIIEDLERFNTPEIFLKLRELNYLLNNSNSIKRKAGRIVFIYAIRDDMFKDTSRTKFFDYISTVIPVINTSNSRDMLLNTLIEKGVNDISDDVCMDLGIYIDDMRILKNIVNEFIQYRNKLKDNIVPKKMLGMILYKNYYPDDFSKLQNHEGIVHSIVSKRVEYHNSCVSEQELEIENLKIELKQITDYYSTVKTKELRALYVMRYIQDNNRISVFREAENDYTPSQIMDNEQLFQKLEKDEFIFCYYSDRYGDNRPLNQNIKFQEIEKKVDSKLSYRERLKMTPKRIEEINNRIDQLKQEILELRTLPLHQILRKYSAEDFYKDTKENKLIAFLIKAGYIDENYFDYISYFYPGVMTQSDKEFIKCLKIDLYKEYNYIIYKLKAVINDIHESLFSKREILNISLLDYIIENRSEYPTQYILIKNNIKKHNATDFVASYYKEGQHRDFFFTDIFSVWSDFFQKEVINEKTKENAEINLEIFLKYFPKSKIKYYQNEQCIEYLASNLEFIAKKLDIILIDNMIFITKALNLKYTNLVLEVSLSKEFLSYIIEGSYFELTNTNIQCILNFINPELGQKYESASYSALIDSQNSNLIDYINENLEYCISEIFPDSSNEENEEAIISIVANSEIESDVKTNYLFRQNNKINLSDIDEGEWDLSIIANIVKPSWQNIEKYISLEANTELGSTILNFISNNSFELSKQKNNGVISDSIASKLFTNLLGDNRLPIESYKHIRNSFYRAFVGFDLSSIENERMDYLIETNAIEFNEFNYELVETHFGSLTHKLILHNKAKYFSSISTFSLKASTALSLLKSNQLKVKEKVAIIEVFPPTILDGNASLSNQVCEILNLAGKNSSNKIFTIELLKNSTNQKQKLNLFVRECIGSVYDKMFVITGLKLLGGDYAAIALQKGQRRKFDIIDDNKQLADYLKRKNFISKYKEEDNVIKINARNI